MADLQSRTAIVLKGWLFLLLAGIACGLLLLHAPGWRTALLLAIAVWSACRFYYFAFYVIEHYVDGEYRFAGLTSFLRWQFTRRRNSGRLTSDESAETNARQ